MQTKTTDFRSYHNDYHLLFLFILADFIETAEALNAIRILCQSSNSEREASLETIQKLLWLLVGSSNNAPRYLNWRTTEGFLPKLRNYCFLFQQKIDGTENDGLSIQHYTEKILSDCMQAIEMLQQDDHNAFVKSLEKAEGSLQRLAKVLARQIHDFHDDENVIFFLVKNRDKMDKIYGHRFVGKLLNKMYPKGLKEAGAFLLKRYQTRGFDQILPEITKKMCELEASL